MSIRKDRSTDVARMVRHLRIKLGLTQEQFATKIGVAWSAIRWENGHGKLSPLVRCRKDGLQAEIL